MISSTILKKLSIATAGMVFSYLALIDKVQAATIAPDFVSSYSLTDLGTVEKLPIAYGGMTFKKDDSNTLLIGGLSDMPDAGIYSVKVTRDSNKQIIGFERASLFAKAPGIGGAGIDAGLTYDPSGNVLFYTTYPDNSIGQIKPGSTQPDKQIDLTTLGIGVSTGALGFVPEGFAGAGRLKITSYSTNTFYDTIITPDGTGTYDIAPPTESVSLINGLDAFMYVKAGSPGFTKDSLLMTEYDTNEVSAYEIDDNGNPIADTRQSFITGLGFHTPTATIGVMGATIDPVTGNFLFSTFFEGEPSLSKIFQAIGKSPSDSCSL